MKSAVYQVPNGEFCLHTFPRRPNFWVAPFRVTLTGTIINVQGGTYSEEGNVKVFFDLVDNAGTWVLCCALGMLAHNKCIRNGSETVLYYGLGRRALQSSPAAIYVMKDSGMIGVGESSPNPSKLFQIQIE